MNPFQRLKQLPWLPLLQVSAITILCVVILETALFTGLEQVPELWNGFIRLMNSVLAVVILGAIAYGVGALGLLLLERLQSTVRPNASVLWALIACLLVMVWLKTLLPLNGLIGLDSLSLVGVTLGVFTTGRRYWRRY
ncbi:MAG: peptide chain release factor 1 [Leptolyngbya sp. DLM2.Bin15]|nr:MAG: peptide chain release factor 1 [Leptolyngbya sp. DLM2.Bin15]